MSASFRAFTQAAEEKSLRPNHASRRIKAMLIGGPGMPESYSVTMMLPWLRHSDGITGVEPFVARMHASCLDPRPELY